MVNTYRFQHCVTMRRFLLFTALSSLVRGGSVDYQRNDGWYNNLEHPKWGAVDSDLSRRFPPRYQDNTQQMSMRHRPNAREISNRVFRGQDGMPSGKNRTALFAFFSEFVAHEIFDVTTPACPMELTMIPLEKCDPQLDPDCLGDQSMPYLRSDFDHATGYNLNRPRVPVNKATSWLDGSFVYGKNGIWASVLRSWSDGKLKSSDEDGLYPGLNKAGLPLKSLPKQNDREIQDIYNMWEFGNIYSHENPGIMSMALLWFRWHNHMADTIKKADSSLSDEAIYRRARRWTIATIQSIVMYEWLTVFLDQKVPPYDGYKDYVIPAVSPIFTTAMHFYQTLLPPGIYIRDECNFRPLKNDEDNDIRLCNSYWDAQAIVKRSGLGPILLGMASQVAEKEDNIVAEDVRGMFYGLYHYSRVDEAAIEIMRGRDFGLRDYQSVMATLGHSLPSKIKDVNPTLFASEPKLLKDLQSLYNNTVGNLDMFVGMLLEADGSNPGPLVQEVILEQFIRIRRADRFWFENENNGLFTKAEIAKIKTTKLSDVIRQVIHIPTSAIQNDVFIATDSPCHQPKQMNSSDLEPCSPLLTIDYFDGSEITYVTSFTCVAVFPLLCILIAYIFAKTKMKKHAKLTQTKRGHRKSMAVEIIDAVFPDYKVTEWRGKEEPARQVCVGLNVTNMELHVVDESNTTLRLIDLKHEVDDTVYITTAKDKTRGFQNLMNLHVKRGYDLVIHMATPEDRTTFITKLGLQLDKIGKRLDCETCSVNTLLKKAITKQKRKDLMETFFRAVFAETYQTGKQTRPPTPMPRERSRSIWSASGASAVATAAEQRIPKEVMDCEITKHEFAESLAMEDNSLFVENLFTLVDTDNNGFISSIELMRAVVLLTKGSPEEKLTLFFRIYDADGKGYLDKDDLERMLG